MSFGVPVRNGVMLGLTASTALKTRGGFPVPALLLNFLSGTLDSRVTFTRALNTATRVNSSGLIETVNANIPRFDYDPVTLQPRGLLIEEGRTNLLLNSLLDGTSLSAQGVTVTATAHTLSFYGTGTVTLSGTHSATVVGAGAYPNRATLSFTPTAGTLTVAVTGSVQFAQLEVGGFATSFIPTAGSAVARNADVATMTGTNFSSWYNQSRGSFVIDFSRFGFGSAAGSVILAQADDGTTTNRLALRLNSRLSDASAQATIVSGGSVLVNAGAGALTSMANRNVRAAMAYQVGVPAVGRDGSVGDVAAVASLPTVNQLTIGQGPGAFAINGHVRTLTYYSTPLPTVSLQFLTA